MDTITYEYQKQRSQFGPHPNFSDSGFIEVNSISVSEDFSSQWIERATATLDLDCTPLMSMHMVNTESKKTEKKSFSFADGAWPKELKHTDPNEKNRFLRKQKADPAYAPAVMSLCKVAEAAIKQNNTIDLFEEYFTSPGDGEDPVDYEAPTSKSICVFRDPKETKRSVTKISWHPESSSKLAVSYCWLEFQKMVPGSPVVSYIWDMNNPNEPDLELTPASPLTCIAFNPRSPDHLVGGCYNGLVAFWDFRRGSQPVETSSIERSHRDPVYDVAWIQSRAGNECVSVSTDGQLLWWDVRKLGHGPADSMTLTGEKDVVFGGTSLEYRSDAGATRYLVGTEQGVVLLCDRKATKDAESQKLIRNTFGARSGKHHGPVYSVQRNPLHVKYFLTVGDWTAKVWMDDLTTPVMATRYDSTYLTAGCWSPTRPGVFYTTKMDGTLAAWDIYHKQNDPIFTTKVADSALTAIKVQQHGRLVAVGSYDGATTILELSDALVEPVREEKAVMFHMFEREQKRERNLELRALRKREVREPRRKPGATGETKTEAKAPAQPVEAGSVLNEEDPDVQAMLKAVEEQFYSLIETSTTGASRDEAAEQTTTSSKVELKEKEDADEDE